MRWPFAGPGLTRNKDAKPLTGSERRTHRNTQARREKSARRKVDRMRRALEASLAKWPRTVQYPLRWRRFRERTAPD